MAGMLQNLDIHFLCLCEEMCLRVWGNLVWDQFPEHDPEHIEIAEMETILLYSLNCGSSFYDPYSLFSSVPPLTKSKWLLFQDMLQTSLKTGNLIWLSNSESIYLYLSHPPKVGTIHITLQIALQRHKIQMIHNSSWWSRGPEHHRDNTSA